MKSCLGTCLEGLSWGEGCPSGLSCSEDNRGTVLQDCDAGL